MMFAGFKSRAARRARARTQRVTNSQKQPQPLRKGIHLL